MYRIRSRWWHGRTVQSDLLMSAPNTIAKGHPHRGSCLSCKAVIVLDNDTFAEVRAGAVKNQCSWAAQARMLIEVGLETMKEPAR